MTVNTKKTAKWQEIKYNKEDNPFVTYYGRKYLIEEFYIHRNNLCTCATLPITNFGGLCLQVSGDGSRTRVWKEFN